MRKFSFRPPLVALKVTWLCYAPEVALVAPCDITDITDITLMP